MQTFTVNFGPRRQPYWDFTGPGEIVLEDDRVVLSDGKRATEIPLTDIANVARAERLVQCHVRVPGSMKVLQLWAADEQTAQQLAQALPKVRTPEFEQELAEHASFATALAALGGRPVVTLTIVILNCAIFVCTVLAGAGLVSSNGALLVQWGTNYGPLTLDGEWWRLLTSMFLHFCILHIALNMWALWDIGKLTEKLYGSAYFVVLYLFAGLAGSIASLLWHPNVNSAGASGAIFGVIGGMLAFVVNPKARIPARIATAHRNTAGVFIAYNLINGFAFAGIDNAAHIGGLIGGFVMGWLLARPVNVEARQHPLPRLAIGVLAGTVVLIALAWQIRR